MQKHTCPICGYGGLLESPGPSSRFWGSQEICSCCGWQFGYNNPTGIEQYRVKWVEAGAGWFLPSKRPAHWSVESQLARIGLTVDAVLSAVQVASAAT